MHAVGNFIASISDRNFGDFIITHMSIYNQCAKYATAGYRTFFRQKHPFHVGLVNTLLQINCLDIP